MHPTNTPDPSAVELTEYFVAARTHALGWAVDLCEHGSTCFLLFRDPRWQAPDPLPLIVLHAHEVGFDGALNDLMKLGVQRVGTTRTVGPEGPLRLLGLHPVRNAQLRAQWADLTGHELAD